jgi:hypothetical protein
LWGLVHTTEFSHIEGNITRRKQPHKNNLILLMEITHFTQMSTIYFCEGQKNSLTIFNLTFICEHQPFLTKRVPQKKVLKIINLRFFKNIKNLLKFINPAVGFQGNETHSKPKVFPFIQTNSFYFPLNQPISNGYVCNYH